MNKQILFIPKPSTILALVIFAQLVLVAATINSYMAELKKYSYASLTHQLEKEISTADFYSLATRLELWSKQDNVSCVAVHKGGAAAPIYHSQAHSQARNCRSTLGWSYDITIPSTDDSKITVALKPSPAVMATIILIFIANFTILYLWVRANKKHAEQISYQEQTRYNLAKQVAHDIRSPVSALKILTQLEGAVNSDAKQLLTDVCARIESIANKLLKESQTEKYLDFKNALHSLVQEKQVALPEQLKLASYIDLPQNLIIKNSADLLPVVSNLMNNAIEAAPPSSTVSFQAGLLKKKLFIEITDEGPGLSPKVLAQAGQTPISQGKAEGHGLGLFGAYEYARQAQAHIEISTRPQILGTRIRLTLPL